MRLALLGLVPLLAGCSMLMPHVAGAGSTSTPTLLGGSSTTTVPAESADRHVQLVAVLPGGPRPVVDCVAILVPAQYSLGLSGGPARHGAVFTFKPAVVVAFWMKDTPTPLDVYWLDAKGNVLGSDYMAPGTTTQYRPPVPIASAVELPVSVAPAFNVSAFSYGGSCR